MSDNSRSTTPSSTSSTTLGGLAVRLYWLFFGHVLAAVFAMSIITAELPGLSLLDLGYAVALALLIGARHLDVTRLGGLTAEGAPATLADFKRFALLTGVIGAAVWGLAHAVAAA